MTSKTRHPAAAATAAKRSSFGTGEQDGATLGSERDHDEDDSDAEDDGREEEVGHHQVRVEIEANGESAEGRLRESSEKDAERPSSAPSEEAKERGTRRARRPAS